MQGKGKVSINNEPVIKSSSYIIWTLPFSYLFLINSRFFNSVSSMHITFL